MVARHENAHLAERLIAATCLKQGIAPSATHDPCPTAACPCGASSSRCSSRTWRAFKRQSRFAAARGATTIRSLNRSSGTLKYIDPEFPDTVRLARTRARRQTSDHVRVVQQRAPSQRPQLSHAGRTSTTAAPPRSSPSGTAPVWPRTPPIPSGSSRGHHWPETVSQQPPGSIRPPETDPCEDAPGATDRHPGRPAAWGDLPVTTHQCAIARSRSSPAWGRYSKC